MKTRLAALCGAILICAAPAAHATTVGLCDVPAPAQTLAGPGNPNVNVAIYTCAISQDRLGSVKIGDDLPIAIFPYPGTDSAAIRTILDIFDPHKPGTRLVFQSLELAGQTTETVTEVFAQASTSPPTLGVDYLGKPEDYETWIAIGDYDVNVTVSLASVTRRDYQINAFLAPVPLPAGGLLLLGGLGAFGMLRRRATAPRST